MDYELMFSIVVNSIPPICLATKLYTHAPKTAKIKPKIAYKKGMTTAAAIEKPVPGIGVVAKMEETAAIRPNIMQMEP